MDEARGREGELAPTCRQVPPPGEVPTAGPPAAQCVIVSAIAHTSPPREGDHEQLHRAAWLPDPRPRPRPGRTVGSPGEPGPGDRSSGAAPCQPPHDRRADRHQAPVEPGVVPRQPLDCLHWERAGIADLYVVPADGSAPPRQLTFDGAGAAGTFWAPDSRTIYFLRSGNLIQVPADGSQVPRAVWPQPPGRNLVVARDGTRVAYLAGGRAERQPGPGGQAAEQAEGAARRPRSTSGPLTAASTTRSSPRSTTRSRR